MALQGEPQAGQTCCGCVLGRFYCSRARFCIRLELDAFRPSQTQGSDFNTSVDVSDLRGRGIYREITCFRGGENASGRFFKIFLSPSGLPPLDSPGPLDYAISAAVSFPGGRLSAGTEYYSGFYVIERQL
jgi:hypothetical protein